jgi:hypothetical protein
MPPQDIEELVRWAYAWFNREREPPPAWLPDGEFVNAREDPDYATHRGVDAVRKQHQGWFDSYPDLRVEPLDLRVEPLEIRRNGETCWCGFTSRAAGQTAEPR